ncbi:lytic transglycosylase domain-containing protein [Amycolatopsis minnesotensis]|uniref:Transglycosylase SLT domain-containing protein n=1 Tax=Amycolatopsis minnesotensis TaxID=337894 RepID=A0ABN2SA79_9PSEU
MSLTSKLVWTAVIVGGIVYIGRNTDSTAGAATDTAPIPADYQRHYEAAAGTCPHMDAPLLAAVGKIETNHGRSTLPGVRSGANSAGAAGPMQFLPATFKTMRARHPDIGPDQYDPATAIRAAAHYLCDSGVADGDVRRALLTYNHSSKYASDVQAQARAYR